MKKLILSILLLSLEINAQNKFQSETDGASELRGLINTSDAYFLSVDYSSVAEFKSGIGEYVDFYPSEFKNLNTNSITKGLKILIKVMVPSIGLDGKSTNTALFRSIMLDDSEVKLFISFLEKHVGPKVGKADKKDPKKYETTIKFKEMIFTYASEGKSERITMYARNYGVTGREKGETFIEFWTESQVEKVADLILVLKKII